MPRRSSAEPCSSSSSCQKQLWWIYSRRHWFTIAEGMAFGTGNAVAHRVADAVMGPQTIQLEKVAPEAATASVATTTNMGGYEACGMQSKAFQDGGEAIETVGSVFSGDAVARFWGHHSFQNDDCLNSYGSDISKCQFYMDMLADCRRNSGSVLSS
ncbi:hypothetical protein OROGR_025090 [Orobanche gracilis]